MERIFDSWKGWKDSVLCKKEILANKMEDGNLAVNRQWKVEKQIVSPPSIKTCGLL